MHEIWLVPKLLDNTETTKSHSFLCFWFRFVCVFVEWLQLPMEVLTTVPTHTRSLRGSSTGLPRSWGSPSPALEVSSLPTLLAVWSTRATTSLLLTGRRMSTWLRTCSATSSTLLTSGSWRIASRSPIKLIMFLTWLLIWVGWVSSSPTTRWLCITTPWLASTWLRLLGSMGSRGQSCFFLCVLEIKQSWKDWNFLLWVCVSGSSMLQVHVSIRSSSSWKLPMWASRSQMLGLLRFVSPWWWLYHSYVAPKDQSLFFKPCYNVIIASRCLWSGETCNGGALQALQQRFWHWVPHWKVP